MAGLVEHVHGAALDVGLREDAFDRFLQAGHPIGDPSSTLRPGRCPGSACSSRFSAPVLGQEGLPFGPHDDFQDNFRYLLQEMWYTFGRQGCSFMAHLLVMGIPSLSREVPFYRPLFTRNMIHSCNPRLLLL